MNEISIVLHEYNDTSDRVEERVQQFSVFQIARSLTLEQFTELLDAFLNLGGKGWREGKAVGLQLRFTHRSLQRLAVCFCLGIICGLAEQQYTDPRNETAIATAKKIVQLIAEGELQFGPYL